MSSANVFQRKITRAGLLACAVFCSFAAVLVLCCRPHITQGMYGIATDEERNLAYAVQVTTHGPAVFPGLFEDFLQQGKLRRFYPTPLRVGAILLGGLSMRLGGADFDSLQNLSLAAFILLIVMVCVGLAKHTQETIGLWTGFLVLVSPLQLGMAGRALSDSLVAAVLFACLWLCLEGVERKKTNTGWWTAVALAYSFAFLVKELALILVPISVFLILWLGNIPALKRWWALSAVSVIPLAITGFVLVWAAGSLHKAWQAVCLTATSFSSNVYIARFGRGPWYAYWVDYLLLSPWTLLAYLGWVGLLAGEEHAKKQERLAVAWTVVPLLFLLFAAAFAKNVRYALILDVPIRLGAVYFLTEALKRRFPKHWQALFALAMVAIALGDLRTFDQFFHQGGIYDPVTAELLARRRFF